MKEIPSNRKKGLPTIMATLADRAREDVARGLEPARIDAILALANSGDPRDQARLCRDILERDWSIMQAMATRCGALEGLRWHLEPSGGGERTGAIEELEGQLRSCGDSGEPGVTGFAGLLSALETAILPGYAVVEKLWLGGGRIAGFAEVPAEAVLFLGDGPAVETEEHPQGMPLDPDRFLLHATSAHGDPARGGLVRPLAWLHCFANVGVKDMLGFVERHGMPFIVGKVDQTGWESERGAVKRLIRNFGPSGGGVFTRNVELQLLETHSTGDVYFKMLEYMDDAVARVVLGQTASSGDSAGLSKGDAQSKVRQDLLEADCRRVEASVRSGLLAQWMRYNAPGEAAPVLKLECEAPEDRLQLAQTLAALAGAGLEADAEEMSARFGFKLKLRPQSPPVGAFAMAGEGAPDAPRGASKAATAWLGPVAEAADALAECDDPEEFRKGLERLEAAALSVDSAQFEEVLADAMASGVAAGAGDADRRMAEKAGKAVKEAKG